MGEHKNNFQQLNEFNAQQIRSYIEENSQEINEQQSKIMVRLQTGNQAAKKAPYLVTLAIAQQCKPLSDGSFLKRFPGMFSCFCEYGNMSAKLIETVSLSRCSVTRRVKNLNLIWTQF